MPAALKTMCDPAERVARLLHHLEAIVEAGDRAVIGDRLKAHRLDLLGHRLGRTLVAARAGAADAGVDDDLGALARHLLGDLGTDAARRPGADRDASIEHAHLTAFLPKPSSPPS